MSGATLAQVHPAPTTVIPAKAGIQVGFRENERAAGGVGVMSAIDRGPGYAAFFVGGRTWIPAFAGMTVERVCGGGRRGDRTGAPGAIGWSCQARALRFSPRFHHHRAVMSGARALRFSPRFHHRRPVMSGATLAQVHPAPTTVIPAKAGIQVGFRENERAVGGVDGHVGHRWRTRVGGVLCGGTDLDPRLRGDPPSFATAGACGGRAVHGVGRRFLTRRCSYTIVELLHSQTHIMRTKTRILSGEAGS